MTKRFGHWAIVAAFAAVSITGASPVPAQSRGSQPLFRSGVALVTLDVCVKDRTGRPIGTLGPVDFVIFEDGRPQDIAFFEPADRLALEAVLLLDRSQSMYGERMAQAKQAAIAFMNALGPGDQVGALAFNDRALWLVPWGTERGQARQAIDALSSSGQTALFDAIHIAMRALERRRAGDAESRRALVVLSDGHDTGSHLDFEEVLDATRRSSVIVYAVSLRTDEHGRPLAVPYELAQLAFDTGGHTFTPRGRTLASIYEEIAGELRHSYRLGYVPERERADGYWHRVAVRLSDPNAIVRTRSGVLCVAAITPSSGLVREHDSRACVTAATTPESPPVLSARHVVTHPVRADVELRLSPLVVSI